MNLLLSSLSRAIRSESSSSLNSDISGHASSGFSSPWSPASTAATTVADDDYYDIIQNLFILRDATMEPSTKQAFDRILAPLINQELVHSAYAERYSIALCSIGLQKSAFAPAILISTRTLKAKKKIFAHLAGLEDLKGALKEHNLALHVVRHRFRPAGGENNYLDDNEKLPYLVPHADSNALCGSRIVIPKSDQMDLSYCTSGPTFNVGGRECGKTALHAWEDNDDAMSDADSESSESYEEDDEMDDGLALSLFPNDPDLSDELDDTSALFMDCGQDVFMHSTQTHQLASCATRVPENVQASIKPARRGLSRVRPLYQGPQTDWVLYDAQAASPDVPFSDLVRNEIDGHRVTKFHHEDPDAKVAVAIADHEAVVHGVIQPGLVSLRYGSRTYDLRRVTLEHPLRPGCSGAAVAHRDELCGTILFVSEDVPWAYMMPIEAELKEMEAVCGSPVRLSGAEEVQAVELDSPENSVPALEERTASVMTSDFRFTQTFEVTLDDQIDHNIEPLLPMSNYEAPAMDDVVDDCGFDIRFFIPSESIQLPDMDYTSSISPLSMAASWEKRLVERYVDGYKNEASSSYDSLSHGFPVLPETGSPLSMGSPFLDSDDAPKNGNFESIGAPASTRQPLLSFGTSTGPENSSPGHSGCFWSWRLRKGFWVGRSLAKITRHRYDSTTGAALRTPTVSTQSPNPWLPIKEDPILICPDRHKLWVKNGLKRHLRDQRYTNSDEPGHIPGSEHQDHRRRERLSIRRIDFHELDGRPLSVFEICLQLRNLANALENLHRMAKSLGDESDASSSICANSPRGYHHDLKSSNILVIHDEFKLAGPGFSKFRPGLDHRKSSKSTLEKRTASETSPFVCLSSNEVDYLFKDIGLTDLLGDLRMTPNNLAKRWALVIACSIWYCSECNPRYIPILLQFLAVSARFTGHEASQMQKSNHHDDKVIAWLQGVENGCAERDGDDGPCVA